jgi:hypothetical protein
MEGVDDPAADMSVLACRLDPLGTLAGQTKFVNGTLDVRAWSRRSRCEYNASSERVRHRWS